MSSLLISPVTAVTCDAQFQVIENAAIHVQHNRITYVGPMADAPPFAPDETLGGAHIVAMPGLVNTHTHAAMTLLRGFADDMALEPWLNERIWPYEANLQVEDVIAGTRLAIVEMLRGGTTTFADMYFFYERAVEEMIESGMRACPSAVLLGFLPEPMQRIRKGLNFAREFMGAGDGRITPFLAPHSLYTCDKGQWKAIIEGARDGNFLIHTHIAETKREVADVTAQWGQTPVQTLMEIGALEGPLLAAHCVHLDERDFEIMARQRDGRSVLRVAHNPTSNLKLASGTAPIPRLLEMGVTVGVGPDGTASNNRLDMWQEMRLAALLHKGQSGDPTSISAQQALLMATREGARALNLHDVGTLEAGMKADIVLVDFDKPHLYPRHNVVSHLVYAAASSDVDSVLIDGQVLLRRGEFTRLDAPAICARAQERAQILTHAYESASAAAS